MNVTGDKSMLDHQNGEPSSDYLRRILNARGFRFQYAVVRRAFELNEHLGGAQWRLQATGRRIFVCFASRIHVVHHQQLRRIGKIYGFRRHDGYPSRGGLRCRR